jgi:hypothetical protein
VYWGITHRDGLSSSILELELEILGTLITQAFDHTWIVRFDVSLTRLGVTRHDTNTSEEAAETESFTIG